MKTTNFDRYLARQMEDARFAERFERAGQAWDAALHARVRVVFELDEKAVKRVAQLFAPYRAKRAPAK